MAAPIFIEFDTTVSALISDLKNHIITQADWTPVVNTSWSTSPALLVGSWGAYSNSFSTDESIPVGAQIVITGLDNLSTFSTTVTSVFGSGPYTINVAEYHTGTTFAAGSSVSVAETFLTATTPAGAVMFLGLQPGGPNQLQINVYRSHNGTVGIDRVTRYVVFRSSGGTTKSLSDPLHVTLSVSNNHIFISIEGPRSGESGRTDNNGSDKQAFVLCAVIPYHASDAVPAVALIGNSSSSNVNPNEVYAYISRNQANTQSWVSAKLGSIAVPVLAAISSSVPILNPQPASDGKTYFWPYVVVETLAGLRGRLAVFFAGFNFTVIVGDPVAVPGSKATIDAVNYTAVTVTRTANLSVNNTPFGIHQASREASVVIMVPSP